MNLKTILENQAWDDEFYAACWGIANDETIAWSYHCLEEIPENGQALPPEGAE